MVWSDWQELGAYHLFCTKLVIILRQVDISVAHVLMSFLCGVLTDKLDLTLITRQPHVNNYSSELFDNNWSSQRSNTILKRCQGVARQRLVVKFWHSNSLFSINVDLGQNLVECTDTNPRYFFLNGYLITRLPSALLRATRYVVDICK